ncbi:MAG: hypothetical protein WAL80_15550 [Xanthobacteraceae bacterium]|jgi:hypothetical protein
MASPSVKPLACALGLALLLTSSAAWAKKQKKPVHHQTSAANAEHCRGANLAPCGPVYFENYYLGDDPDPFIRSQIQRDLGAKFGGPE